MSKVLILILMHAIGDFFLQGNRLSKLKTLKVPYLLEHVGIYTGLFLVLSPLILGLTIVQGIAFSLLNGLAHLVVDYFTGKLKARYVNVDEPKYLTVIGVDHTLHLMILIATYVYLFPGALNTYTFFS